MALSFNPASRELLYGTGNGLFGTALANNTNIRRGWTSENDGHLGGVNSVVVADVTQDGSCDLVVGRDDG